MTLSARHAIPPTSLLTLVSSDGWLRMREFAVEHGATQLSVVPLKCGNLRIYYQKEHITTIDGENIKALELGCEDTADRVSAGILGAIRLWHD